MRLAIAYDANVARLAELATALGNICDDNTVFHVAVNGHLGDKLASWSKEELAEALGRVYETASTALAKAAP